MSSLIKKYEKKLTKINKKITKTTKSSTTILSKIYLSHTLQPTISKHEQSNSNKTLR